MNWGSVHRFEQIPTCAEPATTSPQVLNEIKALLHPDVVQERCSLIVFHSG